MRNLTTCSILVALVLFISCSKKSTGDEDRESPVVVLASPADGATLTGAQTIHITGTVTDNRYISEVHIEVSDIDSGEEYLHVHIHPASGAYNYDQPFAVSAGKNYKIRVIADDAGSNSSLASASVQCN